MTTLVCPGCGRSAPVTEPATQPLSCPACGGALPPAPVPPRRPGRWAGWLPAASLLLALPLLATALAGVYPVGALWGGVAVALAALIFVLGLAVNWPVRVRW